MRRIVITLDLPDSHPWVQYPPPQLAVEAEDDDEIVFTIRDGWAGTIPLYLGVVG